MEQLRFSHVANVPDYMKLIVKTVQNKFALSGGLANKKILDLPAGNGWVSDSLAKLGATVVPADINEERPNYVQANMEHDLPFVNEEFDCVICAEGIEHVLRPEALFSELARVLKKGGLLIITTPNVQNVYSRFQYSCTGFLYQFSPFNLLIPKQGELRDRGHISPVFYTQLRYFSDLHGLVTLQPDGDKYKRSIVFPFFIPFLLLGYWWAKKEARSNRGDPKSREIITHLFSIKVLLSRSIIFKAIKY